MLFLIELSFFLLICQELVLGCHDLLECFHPLGHEEQKLGALRDLCLEFPFFRIAIMGCFLPDLIGLALLLLKRGLDLIKRVEDASS